MDAGFFLAEMSRREAMRVGAGLGAGMAAGSLVGADAGSSTAAGPASDLARSPRRFSNRKSINLWALPYPARMSLRDSLAAVKRAGFEGVELNFDEDGDLSPRAGEADVRAIGEAVRAAGLEVSGLCSFLFWPYPLTAADPAAREKSLDLAGRMVRAAGWLGTENLLVVPGAVWIPWQKDSPVVPFADVDRRAREAVGKLLPLAEKHKVRLNIENIFFNGFLMTPAEMVEFVDSFKSPWVRVHFDTGNVMAYQFPEHWIPILGSRIANVHLKEWSKEGTDFSLAAFRPLLDGTTDWPAVMEAFDKAGYKG